jgi:hypothetical protein
MNDHPTPLIRLLTEELARPAPREAVKLAAEIRRRHGAAVAAILFYGSCLRKRNTADGVLDFYGLGDSYRTAYSSWTLAWLNVMLPPNVFYLELQDGQGIIRGKYAIISLKDFAHGASPRSVPAIVWARFCQPALLVYARDESARMAVVRCVVQAALTMVGRMATLLPASGTTQRFRSADLWQRGFAETYRTELRPENPATIQELYEAAPDRYDHVTLEALLALERRGLLHLRVAGHWLHVTMSARQRLWTRLDWKTRRFLAKALYGVRLLKSAVTFGDWLPYVLWKLERHTRGRITLTERQRRHPLLWGWPVIFRLLLRRALR